eukprot:5611981-Prymnesium_polylepis.1
MLPLAPPHLRRTYAAAARAPPHPTHAATRAPLRGWLRGPAARRVAGRPRACVRRASLVDAGAALLPP